MQAKIYQRHRPEHYSYTLEPKSPFVIGSWYKNDGMIINYQGGNLAYGSTCEKCRPPYGWYYNEGWGSFDGRTGWKPATTKEVGKMLLAIATLEGFVPGKEISGIDGEKSNSFLSGPLTFDASQESVYFTTEEGIRHNVYRKGTWADVIGKAHTLTNEEKLEELLKKL